MGRLSRAVIRGIGIPALLFLLFTAVTPPADMAGQKKIDASLYLESGKNFLDTGDLETARTYFLNAVERSLEEKDEDVRLESLLNLGLLDWLDDKKEPSVEQYQEALSVAEKLGRKSSEERARTALKIMDLVREGLEYQFNDRLEESSRILEKALELSRRMGSAYHELICLRKLSFNFYRDKVSSRFAELVKQSLNLARKLNLKEEALKALFNLGTFYFLKEDSINALIYNHEALKAARELGTASQIQGILSNMAVIYLNFGDFEKSGELLTELLEISKKKEPTHFDITVPNSLGMLFMEKALLTKEEPDYKQALRYFEDSHKIIEMPDDNESSIMSLNNTAIVHLAMGNASRAAVDLKAALEIAQKGSKNDAAGTLRNNLGYALLMEDNLTEAEEAFSLAMDIGNEILSKGIRFSAVSGLAEISGRRGDTQKAVAYYKEAIRIIDAARDPALLDVYQGGHIRRMGQVYENLMDIYWNRMRADPSSGLEKELFSLAEQAKAHAFLEYLKNANIPISGNGLDKIHPEEEKLLGVITGDIDRMDRSGLSESEREEIEARLLQTEEEYAALLSRLRRSGAHSLEPIISETKHLQYVQKRLLTRETALIEYFLGEIRSYVFLVTQDSIRVVPLPGRDDLTDSIKAYLKFLQNPSIQAQKSAPAARRLYGDLVSPIEKHIPSGVEHLLIIPDNILFSLPFETLLIPAEDHSDKDQFLIDRYAVSYMPSAASILYLRQQNLRPSFGKDLLVFAEPSYSIRSIEEKEGVQRNLGIFINLLERKGYSFNELPYTREEAERISRYFDRNRTDKYIKDEATEARFKRLDLKEYKIIHLACHGLLDERFPLRSALVFSLSDTAEDGLLKVSEIYGLKLNAEMVVLSACQTGQGKIEGNEGVLGIPRIFFYVGARSLVTTLWEINDRATALFMDYFYGYLKDGLSKAEALRRAKIKMARSSYSHPFYWGGYVLNGDYEAVISSQKTR
jgi:CHAT domain-containing protein